MRAFIANRTRSSCVTLVPQIPHIPRHPIGRPNSIGSSKIWAVGSARRMASQRRREADMPDLLVRPDRVAVQVSDQRFVPFEPTGPAFAARLDFDRQRLSDLVS